MLQILLVVAIGKLKLSCLLKQASFSLSLSSMIWCTYPTYKKQRIPYHKFKGLTASTITKILMEEEGLGVTRQNIRSFQKCYRQTHTIGRQPGHGRPSVISEEVKKIVEAQMQASFEF